jgi:MFS family permease
VSLGPNYRRLWVSSAFGNLGDGIYLVAIPLLALELTRSPALVAGATLAGSLPWLFFALPAGAYADRLDRRRTMTAVNLVRVVAIGSLALAEWADLASIPLLYAVALVLGVAQTFFDTAAQSLMPALVARDDLSRANARLYAVEMTMNQFAGPPAGGALAQRGVGLSLGASAVSYLAAAIPLARMQGSFRPVRETPAGRLRSDIAEGLRYVWGHRVLRTFALLLGLMNLVSTAMFAVFPLFAVRPGPMGLSKAGFGLLLAAFTVGALLASGVTARLEGWVGPAPLLVGTVVIIGLPFFVPYATAAVIPNAIAFVVASGAGVTWNIVTVSMRQRITPDHLLGRMNATYRLLGWGGMPLGAAIGGAIGELFGLRAVFLFAGVVSLLLVPPALLVLTPRALAAAETPP